MGDADVAHGGAGGWSSGVIYSRKDAKVQKRRKSERGLFLLCVFAPLREKVDFFNR